MSHHPLRRSARRTRRLLALAPMVLACLVATAGDNQSALVIRKVAPDRVEVTWQGAAGRTYVLSGTSELGSNSWRTTEAPIAGDDLPIDRSFPIGAAKRFFRLTHTDGDLFGVADFDGDGVPTSWEIDHAYDPLDPLSAAQDDDGDGRSALAEYRGATAPDSADAPAISYIYDAKGQLTKVIHPDGRSVDYAYDAAGNMLQVTPRP